MDVSGPWSLLVLWETLNWKRQGLDAFNIQPNVRNISQNLLENSFLFL